MLPAYSLTCEAYKTCHLRSEIHLISDLQKSDVLFQCYGSKGRQKTRYLFTPWKAGHRTIPSEHSPAYHRTY